MISSCCSRCAYIFFPSFGEHSIFPFLKLHSISIKLYFTRRSTLSRLYKKKIQCERNERPYGSILYNGHRAARYIWPEFSSFELVSAVTRKNKYNFYFLRSSNGKLPTVIPEIPAKVWKINRKIECKHKPKELKIYNAFGIQLMRATKKKKQYPIEQFQLLSRHTHMFSIFCCCPFWNRCETDTYNTIVLIIINEWCAIQFLDIII